MARARPLRSTSHRRAKRRARLRLMVVAGALIAFLGLRWLVAHPRATSVLAVAVVTAGLAAASLYLAWVRSQRRRAEALTRSVAVADTLTGPEFEEWVAALLRRTGFQRVRVSGGAGDLGADVSAVGPDGRLLVVQCKRFRVGRPVGSPAVQKLAGTARAVHEADLAVIVTTSTFSRPARDFAATVGIGLVDRDALARWAADGLPPVALVNPAGRGGAAIPPGSRQAASAYGPGVHSS